MKRLKGGGDWREAGVDAALSEVEGGESESEWTVRCEVTRTSQTQHWLRVDKRRVSHR